MPKFESTRTVAHTPENMFNLVADIEKYPEFVPLCQRLVVRSRKERDDKELLVADMTVAFKMVRETFTTQVYLKPLENQIDVQYVDGPFRFLQNQWRFEAVPEGCKVHFFIEYEFKSRTLGLLMGSMFDFAFRKFSQVFEDRANFIYGKASAQGAAS
ncbi:type II toxin-antitoxin system RatA family toxin [Aureimonas fodinaquatilis]|uniref:Type II toxin-antitoxin system RatA family toxin n=1 Tax=Aureimonas fodinaquatilis TaxID=2565783 RepID=A0A5B0DVG5_9HYPH|nr:type II toxin-antitoxin system RatA family toxin [Aureimonas fodinaquatilis]KAA0970466.1 type II toxin-antitoxin system RatA family toxin [Aureimonas fodinaquatilis]